MPLPPAAVALVHADQLTADPAFTHILDHAGASLVITAAPGQVICLGAEAGALTVDATHSAGPFGVAFDGGRLALTTRRTVEMYALSHRLAPAYPARPAQFDAMFVPIGSWRTGECMLHEIRLDGPSVVAANTHFSCISRSDMRSSFAPLWRPPFISELMPEDRCHLNSFAADDQGRVRFVTAFAETNTARGYRDVPLDSGVIIDVTQDTIIAKGLGMPHSVRLYDGALYVLDSASGSLWRMDLETRKGEVLTHLPGFARGMRRLGDVLFIGISPIRDTAKALNLPVFAKPADFKAGLAAVDIRTGQVLGLLRLPGTIAEIFDIAIIPGVRRLHIQNPAADHLIAVETPGAVYWLRAEDPAPWQKHARGQTKQSRDAD
jgi:uncharacterized protein (TIGR03032 family)